jgi:phage shock protein A
MSIETLAIVLGIVATFIGIGTGYFTFVTRQGEKGTEAADEIRRTADDREREMSRRLHALELKVAEMPKGPELEGLRRSLASVERHMTRLEGKLDGMGKEMELRDRSVEAVMKAVGLQVEGLAAQVDTLQRHIMNTERDKEKRG